ncbi:DUF2235 domain-containing protein [Acinetobacter sp. YH12023]|uniref:T6SS phospholipase effector Tle1-like catalytic domain-containing protein n=1 Tax=Acinetobacter sp. YH12023 TaxID=2601041 RepID=UPI0015D12FF9|nr:DUF2235 domain-containing protein [Acinetobacter sp. YH12023]
MFNELQKIKNSNQDVSNQGPNAKQDCSDVVNISVFFDGTGNNLENDEKIAKLANPAKLWRNAISYSNFEMRSLKTPIQLSHPIYISGVGTPFNGEINNWIDKQIANSQDTFPTGGATGVGGSRRLEYGEDQISETLTNVLKLKIEQAEAILKPQVEERKIEAEAKIEANLNQHRLIKKINLSIFGFSRGAALARVFSNEMIWNNESKDLSLNYSLAGQSEKIPLDIQFLGLFDTVASFGLPATNMPNKLSFRGRDMVVDPRVKNCLHLVAGNELRFSFPVDLIRKDGKLANPKTWKEIVYPGMHSDVGGGYQPNSQNVDNNFARIPLKHMMDAAVSANVKIFDYLKLESEHKELFEKEFKINEETQQLFNSVKKEVGASTGVTEHDIQNYMKLYYGSYGTLHRRRQKHLINGDIEQANASRSVSQISREEDGFEFPTGPADMATEVERIKWTKNYTTFNQSNITGVKHLFRIFYPAFKLYEMLVHIDEWELESWEKDVSQEAVDFYSNYIHDSKYGFVANVEPFSYFRQRTVYESNRSWKGRRTDKKLGPIYEQIQNEPEEKPLESDSICQI